MGSAQQEGMLENDCIGCNCIVETSLIVEDQSPIGKGQSDSRIEEIVLEAKERLDISIRE